MPNLIINDYTCDTTPNAGRECDNLPDCEGNWNLRPVEIPCLPENITYDHETGMLIGITDEQIEQLRKQKVGGSLWTIFANLTLFGNKIDKISKNYVVRTPPTIFQTEKSSNQDADESLSIDLLDYLEEIPCATHARIGVSVNAYTTEPNSGEIERLIVAGCGNWNVAGVLVGNDNTGAVDNDRNSARSWWLAPINGTSINIRYRTQNLNTDKTGWSVRFWLLGLETNTVIEAIPNALPSYSN